MNSRRFTTAMVTLCPAAFLAGWGVAWLADFGLADVENTGAQPMIDRRIPSVALDAARTDTSQTTIVSKTVGASVQSKSTVEAALTEALQMPPGAPAVLSNTANRPMGTAPPITLSNTANTPMGTAPPITLSNTANTPMGTTPPTTLSNTANTPMEAAPPITAIDTQAVDQCHEESCVNQYLWALYERTPKEDTVKQHDWRKVKVRRRGKTVTVTRDFVKLVDEEFAWKDSKAAEKAGMPMMDYVIGGMDRDFRMKLFHALRAAAEAGLAPGITSAFRDDYRQSIASGLKAAANRSYHGGSLRGGYGHGLAADVVSVKGETRDERWASSEILWKWIDAHGKEFGVGRPYLDRDPSHVTPIDGREYASHHGGSKDQRAGSDQKRRHRLAIRDERSAGKRPRT